MGKYVGLILLAGVFMMGCSSTQDNADVCFALQTAVCAGEFNPTSDLPDFTKCTASAAAMCGVANPPTPVPAQQMMEQYHQ